MKWTGLNELREKFLEFFESKGCYFNKIPAKTQPPDLVIKVLTFSIYSNQKAAV